MSNSAFEKFHPVVNFTYFLVVLIFSMFFMHPVFLFLSFICSISYSIMLNGIKSVKFNLFYMIPLMILMMGINVLVNHEGVTILFYLYNDNPFTKESLIYGLAASLMFISVISWFSCYNKIMTSDKFIFLFGKIVPSISLILSMVLRFVPRYKKQIKAITNSQKCIGRSVEDGTLIQKAKNGLKILSIMVTWALENGVDTADSMKSRGYGLKGRTSFGLFKFTMYDRIVLILIISFSLIILLGTAMGFVKAIYFPRLKYSNFNIIMFLSYLLLCATPIIIEVWEALKWKHIRSKI